MGLCQIIVNLCGGGSLFQIILSQRRLGRIGKTRYVFQIKYDLMLYIIVQSLNYIGYAVHANWGR